jgi:hypothetical protein
MGFSLFLVTGVYRVFMKISLKICLEKIRLVAECPAGMNFSLKENRKSTLPELTNTFLLCSDYTLKVVPL